MLQFEKFSRRLGEFAEGDRLAFVGIGGGSDCVQAAVLAKLAGKKACVISIRTAKTTVDANHGGQVFKGVYRINSETTGNGRFLECVPAELGLPSYLVVDENDGGLSHRVKAALDDFGSTGALFAVDTGGDSLYRTPIEDRSLATPDQDRESLRALAQLDHPNAYSIIVAPGIDTPAYASEVLREAKAQPIRFTSGQSFRILELYRQARMDSCNDKRFGKTALAWQAALKGERGPIRLPLPDRYINDPENPWNPNVFITREMAGAYIMRLADHAVAVGVRAPQPK